MNEQKIEKTKHMKLINELISISILGLNDMFIPEQLEFAEKKILTNDTMNYCGKNRRYTLINLLGLHKAESNGFNISVNKDVNLKKIVLQQIEDINKFETAGDIGLLLWATSLISPDLIKTLMSKIDFKNILKMFKDGKRKITMELSWLLTGVIIASKINDEFKKSFENLSSELYSIVTNNYGGEGIFGHQSTELLSGKIRGNISSFADQVYPIYALAKYAEQYNDELALKIAKEAASNICELQGENGEWMWHYNTKAGSVISKYPVYSVHQDAMAPIALLAVQDVSNLNFDSYIQKGLDWLTKNQLNTNMISKKHNAIWRAIGPAKLSRKFNLTLSHFGISTDLEYSKLSVLEECWSYHLGWILFAFADKKMEQ